MSALKLRVAALFPASSVLLYIIFNAILMKGDSDNFLPLIIAGWSSSDVSTCSEPIILCLTLVPGCGDHRAAVSDVGLLILP